MNARFSIQILCCLHLWTLASYIKQQMKHPAKKALILVPHYNNNLCCRASNKPESQLHYSPPHVIQCLPVHSLSWTPTLPNYGSVQASWVPAYWGEHLDGFQKAEAKRGVLTHKSNRPENRHNWPQHTHHPTTHKPFQSGCFFFQLHLPRFL